MIGCYLSYIIIVHSIMRHYYSMDNDTVAMIMPCVDNNINVQLVMLHHSVNNDNVYMYL